MTEQRATANGQTISNAEKSYETIAKVALEAALNAVSNCKHQTFTSSYKNPVSDMLKAAFESALETIIKSSNETERKLSARIDELSAELKKMTVSKPLLSSVLKIKSVETTQQKYQLVNIVAAENKNRQNRAANVILVGLSQTGNENDNVRNFFTACELKNIEINHVRRINSSKKNTVSNSNIVLVSLKNEKDRASVLQKCSHHKVELFKGVFAREDRTPAQQAEFNEYRANLNKRNNQLAEASLLDNPFRNVIHRRTGEICCINVIKSNEQHRYVFESPASALSTFRKSKASNNTSATTPSGSQ